MEERLLHWNANRDRTGGQNIRLARAGLAVGKSSCPYCLQEVYTSELRRHMSGCMAASVLQDSPQAAVSRLQADGFPVFGGETDSSRSSESHNSLINSQSDAEEEFQSDHLTIRSQFVSLNQSIDSQLAAALPGEKLRKGNMQSATRPPSGKKESVVCPICFSEYDRRVHVPLVLPACGHTMCQRCARSIYNDSSMAKCPICRSKNFEHVRALPVNFALLEINDRQRNITLCSIHEKEVLAYCQDHQMCLCGLCVYEHKSHRSFLLTSPEAATLVQESKGKLLDFQRDLEALESTWKRHAEDQEVVLESTQALLESHGNGILVACEKSVEKMKAGKAACVDQLRDIMKSSEVQEIQTDCATQIRRLTQDLQVLKDRKTHFEQLSITEKLSTALAFRAENYPQPPSLSKVKEIDELMRTEIEYETAVRRNALFPGESER